MASTQGFHGKIIAVSGAASGIGLATAHYLAQRGSSLSLLDIQQKALEDAAELIRKSTNTRVLTTTGDISKNEHVERWIMSTISEFGRLDGAANVAGIFVESTDRGGIANMTDEVWNTVLGVNLTGMMFCLRAQLKVISNGGSIVNTSSVAGLLGSSQFPAYSTSKHGVIGLSKCAAREGGSREVRVNAIVPGEIHTPMSSRASELITVPGFTSKRAIKRAGTPEEVAALIAFLLGDESRFITGSVYQIDGGRIC
ncbi:3-oxoacyl-reductase [Talaromyces proteolyticus]|uniref:3-oxoacyl-reductase n=1 Tax=Talaromyces proteolyticus TaxID=1131652 RepID=A0AAD4Q385_9EURO|nr:3-oxoacyl-reductase [Talaromyces proteolyticus]KAH8701512.1 3-oxoacyl-reductase [Talaromyces proteolyticus]